LIKSVKVARWESANYLEIDEGIQDYLEVCIAEAGRDPSFIVLALGVVARAKNMS
jgi:probable addiction module antidote protein